MDYTPNRAWLANISNFTSSHILYRKHNWSWEISKDDQGSTTKKTGSILNKQKLSLQVDNDFAAIFKNSQMISGICIFLQFHLVRTGRSHYLLGKAVTMKEKFNMQIQDEKNKELLKSVPSLITEIEDLKRNLLRKIRSWGTLNAMATSSEICMTKVSSTWTERWLNNFYIS